MLTGFSKANTSKAASPQSLDAVIKAFDFEWNNSGDHSGGSHRRRAGRSRALHQTDTTLTQRDTRRLFNPLAPAQDQALPVRPAVVHAAPPDEAGRYVDVDLTHCQQKNPSTLESAGGPQLESETGRCDRYPKELPLRNCKSTPLANKRNPCFGRVGPCVVLLSVFVLHSCEGGNGGTLKHRSLTPWRLL